MVMTQMMISGITPGSTAFTTPGIHTFVVPLFNTITIQGWSGGGGGQGPIAPIGTSGGLTSFLGMTLNGGIFGTGVGGAGGTVVDSGTGGIRTFIAGNNGGNRGNFWNGTTWVFFAGAGGSAPNGGTGGLAGTSTSNVRGTFNGLPGLVPGAGGGGGFFYGSNAAYGGGGGSGAYGLVSISNISLLIPGSVINIVVGAGGLGGTTSLYGSGGNGANGRVEINWV